MFAFNATLFIQMIHFGIAYCIVRIFIVKPMLTVILHDDAYAASVRDVVKERRLAIDNKRIEAELYWTNCKMEFAHYTPVVLVRPRPLVGRAHISRVALDHSISDHHIQELAQVIVSKVNHVE